MFTQYQSHNSKIILYYVYILTRFYRILNINTFIVKEIVLEYMCFVFLGFLDLPESTMVFNNIFIHVNLKRHSFCRDIKGLVT